MAWPRVLEGTGRAALRDVLQIVGDQRGRAARGRAENGGDVLGHSGSDVSDRGLRPVDHQLSDGGEFLLGGGQATD